MKRTSIFAAALFAAFPVSAIAGDVEELEALVAQFLEPGADVAALTNALRPTEEEYRIAFSDDVEDGVISTYNDVWDSGKMAFRIKPERTEITVYSARIGDLRDGTGNADEFAGGYKDAAAKMENPDAITYFVRLIEPGQELGSKLSGFQKVGDRWVIFPKPWRVLPRE